ncbi:MAG: flagellar biosynthesis protein FlgI, partial [SAR116 cluster bacterium MED-G04]
MFQVCLVWIILAVSTSLAFADRIKDLASVAGVRSNQLVGYGVVVGLAGTGDGTSALTTQSLQSMIAQFGLVTDAANLSAKNAAA